jgi:CMP-N-acetylneuraminic acid synthetase
LRTAAEIDATVALLDDPAVGSAATATLLGCPISVVGSLDRGRFVAAINGSAEVRRQTAMEAVRLTGGVFATRREVLAGGRLLDDRPAALIVDAQSGIDIDTADDLAEARRTVRRRRA